MTYPVIGRDYHRSQIVHRTCRDAFGSDLERDERWARQCDRTVVWLAAIAGAVVITLIYFGVI